MVQKAKLAWEIYQNMGSRYVAFRLGHEAKSRLGLLKGKFPTNPTPKKHISLEQWRKSAPQFFFPSRESLGFQKNPCAALEEEYEAFLSGKIKYFNAGYLNVSREYDWITNPDSGFRYDIRKHWTEVNDFSKEHGDIKFVWEKSRFSYLHTLIRHDYHFGIDGAKIVFNEISDWIDKNPINQGPNYKCSQEISLRVLNWTFALYYYRNSNEITEELFQKIMHLIYWQLHHVYHNINFSRIAVRNNHAITETLMLYLGGLLFPFFPDSQLWKRKGKKWFEEEVLYQVYEDGTFLQFSHNYHRVLLQLLTWGFNLAELNGERFSEQVYVRAKRTLQYLYQCQIEKNGYLPNYGTNDGALFFKLNSLHYRDYRPQINALYYFFFHEHLYHNEEHIHEDALWMGGALNKKEVVSLDFQPERKPLASFPNGGIYTIRDKNSLTFIKCASYRDRPAHADNLHIDIWYKGDNVLRDAGTYQYNTTPELTRYFNGTSSHNTVTLGDYDQMQKGPRFIWLKWSESQEAHLLDEGDRVVFKGSIRAFRQVSKDIIHRREVIKHKELPRWQIEDVLEHSTNQPMKQWWNISDSFQDNFTIRAYDANEKEIEPRFLTAYYSSHYGKKDETQAICFQTSSHKINTVIEAK